MSHEEEDTPLYQVVVSPRATVRMGEHFEFLVRISETAAKRLLNTLVADMRSLTQMPSRCPPYDRRFLPEGEYRWKLSAKRYRIVFEIVDDCVFIEDVQDTRESELRRSV